MMDCNQIRIVLQAVLRLNEKPEYFVNGTGDVYRLRFSHQVLRSSCGTFRISHPHANVLRLHRLLHHADQLRGQCIQIGLVTGSQRKLCQHLLGIIFLAIDRVRWCVGECSTVIISQSISQPS